MSIIRQILPKSIQKIKVIKDKKCAYHSIKRKILFSLSYLKKQKYLKTAMEKFYNRTLSLKEFQLLALLHEFGHAYQSETFYNDLYLYNINRIYCDKIIKTKNFDYTTATLFYWNNIPQEKFAMRFAMRIFKLYKNKLENNNLDKKIIAITI